jgi:hypothetical protein
MVLVERGNEGQISGRNRIRRRGVKFFTVFAKLRVEPCRRSAFVAFAGLLRLMKTLLMAS